MLAGSSFASPWFTWRPYLVRVAPDAPGHGHGVAGDHGTGRPIPAGPRSLSPCVRRANALPTSVIPGKGRGAGRALGTGGQGRPCQFASSRFTCRPRLALPTLVITGHWRGAARELSTAGRGGFPPAYIPSVHVPTHDPGPWARHRRRARHGEAGRPGSDERGLLAAPALPWDCPGSRTLRRGSVGFARPSTL